MDINDLIATAKELVQVSKECASEYSSKRDVLVNIMNIKMGSRPDCAEMVGENNTQMMMDNHANHARFLESIFIQHSAEVLTDTVIWVFRAYRSRNFSSTYWAAQLNTWIEIYKAELSEDCFNEIYPYYNWMQINIPTFNSLAEEELEGGFSAH